MTIYFLFGKTGAGKSYIGKLLEQLNILHIDGDTHITSRMRDCLNEAEQMTPDMIDEFVDALIQVINRQKEKNPTQSFVISQAMYLDKHRLRLLNAIPELQFVLIDVPQPLRESRISSRFLNRESKVSLDYAIRMDSFFQPPSHEKILIENTQGPDEILIDQIYAKMPALFDIKPKIEPGSDSQLQLA